MSIADLKVLSPKAVNDAAFVSSNVPENDYPVWAAGTYAKGARVIVLSVHRIFESLVDGNTDNPLSPSSATTWIEVGPTNRWRVFDRSVSSQTKNPVAINYTLKPGSAISTVAILNLSAATSVRVRLIDPVFGDVYDEAIDTAGNIQSPDWWNWFFGERTDGKTEAIFNNLPTFPNAELQIDIAGTSELGVGVIMYGQERSFTLGVEYGASVGIQDYSRKERNQFGDSVLVERAFAKRASFHMKLLASEVDSFNNFLTSVRATPCLWRGSDRYESTTIYGFYKDFSIVISYFDYSDCDLELEGLT